MAKQLVELKSLVGQAPDLVSTLIGGETALMSIRTGSYHSLDRVGSRIWELIATPRTVASVVDQLLAEFAVERPLCEAQALAFLQKLSDDELLHVTDAAA
ncbi:MAG: hypothetical protein RL514_1527 [Verrucomicrobiota bacterium]|jgi:hypothetical protein